MFTHVLAHTYIVYMLPCAHICLFTLVSKPLYFSHVLALPDTIFLLWRIVRYGEAQRYCLSSTCSQYIQWNLGEFFSWRYWFAELFSACTATVFTSAPLFGNCGPPFSVRLSLCFIPRAQWSCVLRTWHGPCTDCCTIHCMSFAITRQLRSLVPW